jgi:hypothetical protein
MIDIVLLLRWNGRTVVLVGPNTSKSRRGSSTGHRVVYTCVIHEIATTASIGLLLPVALAVTCRSRRIERWCDRGDGSCTGTSAMVNFGSTDTAGNAEPIQSRLCAQIAKENGLADEKSSIPCIYAQSEATKELTSDWLSSSQRITGWCRRLNCSLIGIIAMSSLVL